MEGGGGGGGGGGSKTSDKFEATECLYPILPLQNGRFAKKKLHMQA